MQFRFWRARLRRPRITEPERGQQVQAGGFRSSIMDCEANQNIVALVLGIFDEDVEVTVVREHAGVEKFKFKALGQHLVYDCNLKKVRNEVSRMVMSVFF